MVRLFVNAACAILLGVSLACTPGKEVSFSSASLDSAESSTLKGWLAKPEGTGPFPALVLLHTCEGVRNHTKRFWPAELKKSGYVVLTMDSFGSRGLGPCPNTLVGPGGVFFKELSQDAFGALDYLATMPFIDKNRIGVVGYSLGGMVIKDGLVQYSAQRPPGSGTFRAAVSVYGPCERFFSRFTGKYPFQILEIAGEYDKYILEQCQAVKHSQYRVIVLPEAYHAWDVSEIIALTRDPFGNPMLYSEVATQTSREILLDYLAKNLRDAR